MTVLLERYAAFIFKALFSKLGFQRYTSTGSLCIQRSHWQEVPSPHSLNILPLIVRRELHPFWDKNRTFYTFSQILVSFSLIPWMNHWGECTDLEWTHGRRKNPSEDRTVTKCFKSEPLNKRTLISDKGGHPYSLLPEDENKMGKAPDCKARNNHVNCWVRNSQETRMGGRQWRQLQETFETFLRSQQVLWW